MSGRVSRSRLVAGAIAIPLALAAPAAVLAASPSGSASCVGIEMAAISPPGSSDEEPGGAPQFFAEVREAAAGLGLRGGQLIAYIAALHEGSHDACDAALGG